MDAAQRRAKAVNDGNYTLQSGKTLSNLYGEEEVCPAFQPVFSRSAVCELERWC